MSVSFYANTFLGVLVEPDTFVEYKGFELVCKKCPEAPKPEQRYCGFCGKELSSIKINVPTEKFSTWAKAHGYQDPQEAWDNLQNDEFDETNLRILNVGTSNNKSLAFGYRLGTVSSYRGGHTARSLITVNLLAQGLQSILDELGITSPIEIFTNLEF